MHPIIRHPFRFLACLACLVMGNACIAIGEILDEVLTEGQVIRRPARRGEERRT